MVQETHKPGMSVSLVARRNQLSRSMLSRWRKLAAGAPRDALHTDLAAGTASDGRSAKQQIEELLRLLGKKTMECELLKEALESARRKK